MVHYSNPGPATNFIKVKTRLSPHILILIGHRDLAVWALRLKGTQHSVTPLLVSPKHNL